MTNENDHVSKRGALKVGGMQTVSSTAPPAMAAEEDIVADLDEPPELRRSPRPAPLTLQRVSTASSAVASDIRATGQFERQLACRRVLRQESSAGHVHRLNLE
jgi:hypothetical protein